MSVDAATVPTSLTSRGSPPVGPWSVSMRTASSTVEPRPHELGDVAEAGVQVLVPRMALAADDAHVVLHAQRGAAQAVVLGDRHVDHQVGLGDLRVDRPGREPLAAELHVPEALLIEVDHLAARRRHRGGDPAVGVGLLRGMAGVVADLHRLGAGLEAEAHQGPDHLRVGVGRELRPACSSRCWA